MCVGPPHCSSCIEDFPQWARSHTLVKVHIPIFQRRSSHPQTQEHSCLHVNPHILNNPRKQIPYFPIFTLSCIVFCRFYTAAWWQHLLSFTCSTMGNNVLPRNMTVNTGVLSHSSLTMKLTVKVGLLPMKQWNNIFLLVQNIFICHWLRSHFIGVYTNLSSLKTLKLVYHVALRFVSDSGFCSHPCSLKHRPISLYKAVSPHRPFYLCSLLTPKSVRSSCLWSSLLKLNSTVFDKSAFKVQTLSSWCDLHKHLKLDLIIVEDSKSRIQGYLSSWCRCPVTGSLAIFN